MTSPSATSSYGRRLPPFKQTSMDFAWTGIGQYGIADTSSVSGSTAFAACCKSPEQQGSQQLPLVNPGAHLLSRQGHVEWVAPHEANPPPVLEPLNGVPCTSREPFGAIWELKWSLHPIHA